MFNRDNRTKKTNEKINKIRTATEIRDIRSIPNFGMVMTNNPHAKFVQGYYAEITLSNYDVFVPNAPKFPDRYGKLYDGKALFDAPLYDLKEWRDHWQKGHPTSQQPDLLVNANWFNVWDSGVANIGQKINPRKQDRTYLIGLSVSNGKVVSSHTTLDQENIGLDTVIFDEEIKKASLMFHHEIKQTAEESSTLLTISTDSTPENTANTLAVNVSLKSSSNSKEEHVSDGKKNIQEDVAEALSPPANPININLNAVSKEKTHPFFTNKNAVSGFIILKDGVMQQTPKLNNNHDNRLPRTGLGIKNNGKTVCTMVVHNTNREHGVTATEFANLFLGLNCADAINLDNSGSAELYYKGLGEHGKKEVTVRTKTCDFGALSERPKPNCLGFKNVTHHRFFAADDSDIPSKRIKNEDRDAAQSKSKGDEMINYSYYIKR